MVKSKVDQNEILFRPLMDIGIDTTRNKKLLGAPGIATRSILTTNGTRSFAEEIR